MARCTSPGCPAYGRDLQDDAIEFMPAAGVYVCKACWGPVEDPPPPPPEDKSVSAPAPVPSPLPTAAEPPPTPPIAPTIREPAGEAASETHVPEPWEVLPPSPVLPSEPEPVPAEEEPGLGWEVQVESRPWPVLEVAPPSPLVPPALGTDKAVDAEFEIVGAQAFPVIVVYQGGKVRGRYEMQGDLFLIGRASSRRPEPPHLDFGSYTDGKRVSRRHARIFQRGGQYFVEDLGSEHGTWLNEEFLQPNVPYPLSDDDTISIAGVADLEFQMPGSGMVKSEGWGERGDDQVA